MHNSLFEIYFSAVTILKVSVILNIQSFLPSSKYGTFLCTSEFVKFCMPFPSHILPNTYNNYKLLLWNHSRKSHGLTFSTSTAHCYCISRSHYVGKNVDRCMWQPTLLTSTLGLLTYARDKCREYDRIYAYHLWNLFSQLQ